MHVWILMLLIHVSGSTLGLESSPIAVYSTQQACMANAEADQLLHEHRLRLVCQEMKVEN